MILCQYEILIQSRIHDRTLEALLPRHCLLLFLPLPLFPGLKIYTTVTANSPLQYHRRSIVGTCALHSFGVGQPGSLLHTFTVIFASSLHASQFQQLEKFPLLLFRLSWHASIFSKVVILWGSLCCSSDGNSVPTDSLGNQLLSEYGCRQTVYTRLICFSHCFPYVVWNALTETFCVSIKTTLATSHQSRFYCPFITLHSCSVGENR